MQTKMKDNPMQHDQVTTRIAVMLFRILQFFPEEIWYSPWIHGLKCVLKFFTILSVGFERKVKG